MKIKRFDEFVFEKRSHYDTNVDVSFEGFLNNILSKYNIDDVFVSFRDKLTVTSINPNNEFETPTGFYSYPMSFYKEKLKDNMSEYDFRKIFPFKSDLPYINFFILKNRNGILDKNTSNDKLKVYVTKIKDMYSNNDIIVKVCDTYLYDNYSSRYGNDKTSDTHLFYEFLLYEISSELSKGIKSKRTTVMTNLCNRLGINGFIDYGDGYIHFGESFQAVFFKTKTIGDLFIYSKPKVNDAYNKNRIKVGLNPQFLIKNVGNKIMFIDGYGKNINGDLLFDAYSDNTNTDGTTKINIGDKWSLVDVNGRLVGDGKVWFNFIGKLINGFIKVRNDELLVSYIDSDYKLIGNGDLWFKTGFNFDENGFTEVQTLDKHYRYLDKYGELHRKLPPIKETY